MLAFPLTVPVLSESTRGLLVRHPSRQDVQVAVTTYFHNINEELARLLSPDDSKALDSDSIVKTSKDLIPLGKYENLWLKIDDAPFDTRAEFEASFRDLFPGRIPQSQRWKRRSVDVNQYEIPSKDQYFKRLAEITRESLPLLHSCFIESHLRRPIQDTMDLLMMYLEKNIGGSELLPGTNCRVCDMTEGEVRKLCAQLKMTLEQMTLWIRKMKPYMVRLSDERTYYINMFGPVYGLPREILLCVKESTLQFENVSTKLSDETVTVVDLCLDETCFKLLPGISWGGE